LKCCFYCKFFKLLKFYNKDIRRVQIEPFCLFYLRKIRNINDYCIHFRRIKWIPKRRERKRSHKILLRV